MKMLQLTSLTMAVDKVVSGRMQMQELKRPRMSTSFYLILIILFARNSPTLHACYQLCKCQESRKKEILDVAIPFLLWQTLTLVLILRSEMEQLMYDALGFTCYIGDKPPNLMSTFCQKDAAWPNQICLFMVGTSSTAMKLTNNK